MSHPTFRIAIGADHGAVDLKNAVVKHLKAVGHEVKDFGTQTTESVDYSDYANLVARNVGDGTTISASLPAPPASACASPRTATATCARQACARSRKR
jgi:hypothetical protein